MPYNYGHYNLVAAVGSAAEQCWTRCDAGRSVDRGSTITWRERQINGHQRGRRSTVVARARSWKDRGIARMAETLQDQSLQSPRHGRHLNASAATPQSTAWTASQRFRCESVREPNVMNARLHSSALPHHLMLSFPRIKTLTLINLLSPGSSSHSRNCHLA